MREFFFFFFFPFFRSQGKPNCFLVRFPLNCSHVPPFPHTHSSAASGDQRQGSLQSSSGQTKKKLTLANLPLLRRA